ncbi:hypothetical protein DRO69_12230 [Candidatus Bathyarchaeota archaeon]|nr:MAG: hypothetical protein DRO69_12230 [Candidatus Bathyarchaeota archaeon]
MRKRDIGGLIIGVVLIVTTILLLIAVYRLYRGEVVTYLVFGLIQFYIALTQFLIALTMFCAVIFRRKTAD